MIKMIIHLFSEHKCLSSFFFTANLVAIYILLPLLRKNYTLVSGEYKCFLSFSFRFKLISTNNSSV